MPPKRKRQPKTSLSALESNDDGSRLAPPPTFYNTTFTPHRISPLHVGSEPLTASRLRLLEKQLRDTLVGDIVRGVQIGLEGDATLGGTGTLESVEWRWVGLKRLLGKNKADGEDSVELGTDYDGEGSEEDDEEGDGGGVIGSSKALSIELHYENNTFTAILLPDLAPGSETQTQSSSWTSHPTIPASSEEASTEAFVQLPLLLLRMPAPLKSAFIDFLSTTFDVRISALRLGTRTLVSCWEEWLAGTSVIMKDVAMTLGFHIGSPSQNPDNVEDGGSASKQEPQQMNLGLKTIDLIIPPEEVMPFVREGEKIQRDSAQQGRGKRRAKHTVDVGGNTSPSRRRRLAGNKDEEGWEWRRPSGEAEASVDDMEGAAIHQPFTEAVHAYLARHLALDLFHPGVRILRIACFDFVLGESRVKIFDRNGGNSAVRQLVEGLVNKAKGKEFWEVAEAVS